MARQAHVSELLAEVFRRAGIKRGLRRAEAVLLWPQVAGMQLSRFTRARNVVDGVLVVDVSDSETAMHLTLERTRFLDAYQGKFGMREVRDIRFQSALRGSAEDSGEEPARAEPRVDHQDLSRLARELGTLELPESLAGPAMQAGRALLAYRARKRADGWVPCPACGALAEGGDWCEACRRYAEQPRVQRAAGALAVNPGRPTPQLTEEERAVAGLLAQRQLEGDLFELLPQVLADGSLRAQLETAARCLLALRLEKPPEQVDDRDLALLPPRVARVLGHWSLDSGPQA